MNDNTLRFRFGIFVLAGLILLAVLIVLFGGLPNVLRTTESYTIVFANAQGITAGAPVRRSGVRIGEVQSVALINETGKVQVTIRIDGQYLLRRADRATLVQGLLGGDTSIALMPPEDEVRADLTLLDPGAELQGLSSSDVGAVMQKTSDLVQPAQEALIEMRKVLQRIDKMAPTFEATLKDFRDFSKLAGESGPDLRELAKMSKEVLPEIQVTARTWGRVGERVDIILRTNEDKIVKSIERMEETLKRVNDVLSDENQKSFRETLKNVRDASRQFESIAKDSGELVKDSRVLVKQVTESLKRAEGALSELQKGLKPVGERGAAILKNVEESSESLSRTLKDVRELVQVLARGDGTVQKLLSDPGLYNNLNDSAEMVTRILPRLDRVLRDVEIFADKLARHPELIGIGGAIRPSTGLKESPSVIPYRVIPWR